MLLCLSILEANKQMCHKHLLSRQYTSLQISLKLQVETSSLHYPIHAWEREKGTWRSKETPKVSAFAMMGFIIGILIHGPFITVGSIITISITFLSMEQACNVFGVPLESIAKLVITLWACLIYEDSWITQLQYWNFIEMNIWPLSVTPFKAQSHLDK